MTMFERKGSSVSGGFVSPVRGSRPVQRCLPAVLGVAVALLSFGGVAEALQGGTQRVWVGEPGGPTPGSTDTADLVSAVATANGLAGTVGNVILIFYPRTYELFPGDQHWARLEGFDALTVGQANGTAILNFKGYDAQELRGGFPQPLFEFRDIGSLSIRGLEARYETPAMSTGLVTSKAMTTNGPNGMGYRIEIELDEDPLVGPSQLADDFFVQRLSDYDYDPGSVPTEGVLRSDRVAQLFNNHVPGTAGAQYATSVSPTPGPNGEITAYIETTLASPQKFVDQLASLVPTTPVPGSPGTPGVGLVISHSKFLSHLFSIADCDALVLLDIHVRDTSGMTAIIRNCGSVTAENYKISPQNGRMMSASADGINMQDCAGPICFLDCEMERMGDDGVNIHGFNLQAIESPELIVPGDPNGGYRVKCEIGKYNDFGWQQGDELLVRDGDLAVLVDPIPSMNPTVLTDVSLEPPLDPPVPGAPLVFCIEAASFPPGLVAGGVITNVTRSPGEAKFINCTVEQNVARGLNVKNYGDLTITNCTFRENTGPGVHVSDGLQDFAESAAPKDLVIEGCTFVDCNRYMFPDGSLSIETGMPLPTTGFGPVPSGVYPKISIRGNAFSADIANSSAGGRYYIAIDSGEMVNLRSNTFEEPGVATIDGLISLDRCGTVLTQGNVPTPPGPGFSVPSIVADSETTVLPVQNPPTGSVF